MLKIIGFLCTSLTMTVLSAATLIVDLNGGADYTDIHSAIDAAKDGDTVLLEVKEPASAQSISRRFTGSAAGNFLKPRAAGSLGPWVSGFWMAGTFSEKEHTDGWAAQFLRETGYWKSTLRRE